MYITTDQFLLNAFPRYKWSVANLELFALRFSILIDVSNTGKRKKKTQKINRGNQRALNRCESPALLSLQPCDLWKPAKEMPQGEADAGDSVCRLLDRLIDGSCARDVSWPCLWWKGACPCVVFVSVVVGTSLESRFCPRFFHALRRLPRLDENAFEK